MYVKTVFASLLLGLLLSSCTRQPETRQATPRAQNTIPFRVMSFNIRYNNPGDEEHAWPHRVDRVASTILFNNTDIVGVQEALKEQLDDLSAKLPGYTWVGVGRDDGAEAGEYTAIFYKEDRFSLLANDTFWLSKTPEVPGSKDWDAALTRIATWGHFEDTMTGSSLYVFNTHFDHRGAEARTQSAGLIASRATEIAGDAPLVVTGDFNFTPAADGYAALTEKLSDAFHTTKEPHHGPASTIYRGFEVTHEPGRRIDYIFTNDVLTVRQHAILSDNWDGAFASDHLAVLATLALNN
ncbi:MAG: endonuclease/exonuclease/phosphatase family protein [Bacteroidota bacterium]